MFNKPLAEITEADLQSLIDNSVAESKTLDYKVDIVFNNKDDKAEFLADIISFANSSGGHLIIGMTETAGVADGIPGVTLADPDAKILELENIIRDKIEPRVPGIEFKELKLANNNYVIIVNIPRSWVLPHRETFKNKFCARNSKGKYPLDIQEIRDLVLLSDTMAEKVRNFRAERMASIIAQETPVQLYTNPKIVFQMIPAASLQGGHSIDLKLAHSNQILLPPITKGGWNNKYNFDGLLTYTNAEAENCYGYLQLYRSGIIETVDCHLIGWSDKKQIYASAIENMLLENGNKYIEIYSKIGIQGPIIILLSFLGVKGYRFALPQQYWESATGEIDRDNLVVPEVVLDDIDSPLADTMKPMFDVLWNSAGAAGSINYDAEGNRKGDG